MGFWYRRRNCRWHFHFDNGRRKGQRKGTERVWRDIRRVGGERWGRNLGQIVTTTKLRWPVIGLSGQLCSLIGWNLLSHLILTVVLPSVASNPRKGAILGIWQPEWFWDFRLFSTFPICKMFLIFWFRLYVTLGQKVRLNRLNWKSSLSLLSQRI